MSKKATNPIHYNRISRVYKPLFHLFLFVSVDTQINGTQASQVVVFRWVTKWDGMLCEQLDADCDV